MTQEARLGRSSPSYAKIVHFLAVHVRELKMGGQEVGCRPGSLGASSPQPSGGRACGQCYLEAGGLELGEGIGGENHGGF